jgi:hypothetical protein
MGAGGEVKFPKRRLQVAAGFVQGALDSALEPGDELTVSFPLFVAQVAAIAGPLHTLTIAQLPRTLTFQTRA